ncbi:MAG: tyrosine--tRNA ligase [Caldiserica bacterium]|nr:tyrosine--tRNA ligase [Caldisericota bacterium]
MRKLQVEEELTVIQKGSEEIITREELKEKLIAARKEGRGLKIKWGADPTAPDLHLGHMVVLRKLKDFQDLGHEVIFLIGDFTATIGDPSGKTETRPPLSEKEVKDNARTYTEQVFKILDREKTKVVYNSSWLKDISLRDFLNLASLQSVSRMLERNEFQERIKTGKDIRISEFLYPLLQAYDSVVLDADVEIGATEQKFNLLMGRVIQKRMGKDPQVVITLPILEGLDGKRKMSKSFGNYIGINEPPEEIFGKIMSIPDEIMFKYYLLLTPLSQKEIEELKRKVEEGKLHPKEVKENLAFMLTSFLHSEKEAEKAKADFQAKHKPHLSWEERIKDLHIEEVRLDTQDLRQGKIWICRLIALCKAASSNSEAARLIQQGAVEIEGKKIRDKAKEIPIQDNRSFLLRVGKRRVYRVLPPT